ncbi:MAG: chromosome segregation protein SMC, partial [Burkholderiaceae bacterium]|nr:chromosome segregation protein SMC [Burkholderiaceae bacterium]
MRLKQIKLAGFKSFVDPTAFDVPGQLVGVVGPNGCGKSNIIDAVRWVLGESKASELRGESMQDVIFSGSSERKPAVRASVELVFDNTLGRIAGNWSQYVEISVKRVLTRDGQSTYFINNQPVRRRDVHDMFLGTGLGPRAYAIIGQGMISRIIEARPEELRVFLEEAAGVSKYKERRRETENRLADTRENLTRVEDILRELNLQIEKLERQAEVAQQYRKFETERDARQRMLWLVRRDEADSEQQRLLRLVSEAALELDARLAEQRTIEAEIEAIRAAHYQASDAVHAAQGHFYDRTGEVSRIESEIRLVSQTQGQLRERLDSVEQQATRAQSQQDDARRDRLDADQRLVQARLLADRLASIAAQRGDDLPALEVRAREARGRVEEARAQVDRTRQAIEVCALHERQASAAREAAVRRRDRLQAEGAGLHAFDPQELARAAQALADAEERDRRDSETLKQIEGDWSALEAQRQPSQQSLREAEARLAQIDARMSALRQLQERLESQAKVQPWLARHGLDRLARLYQKLRIEDGWGNAIESVLRERVNALEVGRIDHVAGLAADAPPSKVGFFAAAPAACATSAAPGLRPLLAVVQSGDAGVQSLLAEWLLGYYAADSLEAAMARRADLPPGAQFVVAAGHLVGRQSILMYAADSEQEGVLARRHELENLTREHRARALMADQARSQAAQVESGASQRLARLMALRDEHNRALEQMAQLRLEVQRLEQERARVTESRERIDSELQELATQLEGFEKTIATETGRFEQLDGELGEHQQRCEDLRLALEQAERELGQEREALRQHERDAQEASFSVRAIEAEVERLEALLAQGQAMAAQAASERATVIEKLEQLSDAAARQALQEALGARGTAEQALAAARQRLDDLTRTLRERDAQRLSIEQAQEPLRQRVGKLQLDEQAARISREQYDLQIAEAQLDDEAIAAIRSAFADAPRPSWLQGEVTRLGNAIAALGAVNLAALDELTVSGERKGFLDTQSADLNEAIATLEDAIRR